MSKPENSEPGSEPLANGRHERFCQILAVGNKSQASAYREVYKKAENDDDCRRQASVLLTKVDIKDRFCFLRRQLIPSAQAITEELKQFHLSVLRTPISEITADHPLCQEKVVITKKDGGTTVKLKSVAKAHSASELAKMGGSYEPEQQELGPIKVVIGGNVDS